MLLPTSNFPEALMLFVSHASQDRSAIDGLLIVLRRTRQGVWLDDELGGGEAWWQTILEKIRECDVFIVALSNNSLASKPCRAELAYAQALRRPILPVQIGPVDSVRVTPLAATQIIDYRNSNSDTEIRLIEALQRRTAQGGPLPAPLPAEPEVPFAYLMRLAGVLASPELSHHEQAGLVSELRNKLDEDCADPTAHRDIVRLLYLLRDRPDVTWRTRSDVDAVLSNCDGNLSTPAGGLSTVPFAAPQPVLRAPSGPQPVVLPPPGPQRLVPPPSDPQPIVEVSPSGLQAALDLPTGRARPVVIAATDTHRDPPRRLRRLVRNRWFLAGGVAAGAIAAILVAVVLNDPQPQQTDLAMLDDSELDTIMGVSGMKIAESGVHRAKHTSGVIEVSPPDCAGVLYPGLDRTYRDSGGAQVTWRVSEDRGGMGRAGVDGNRFVDQDVAVFPAHTDRALAFVRASALPWKACAGQTVSVVYRGTEKYTWNVGDVTGEAPKITQSFTLDGGNGYGCQRVLRTVSDMVIDVKACGDHIGDEASRIAGRLAASVTNGPLF